MTNATTTIPNNSVFISYRREVSWALALNVFQTLKRYGIDVFLDHEGLESGHFDDALMHQIASRPYFLLFLSSKTLDRCRDTNDVLLKEITEAIQKERVIIPLYTPEFEWTDADKFLPPDIGNALKRFNGIKLDQDYFDASMKKLTKFINISASIVTMDAPFQNDVAQMTREVLEALQTQDGQETPVEIEKLVSGLKIKISGAPATSVGKKPETKVANFLQNIQWKIILVAFSLLTSYYVGRLIARFFSFGSIYLIGSVVCGFIISFGFIAFYSGRWGGTQKPLFDVIKAALLAAIGPVIVLGVLGVFALTQMKEEKKNPEDEE